MGERKSMGVCISMLDEGGYPTMEYVQAINDMEASLREDVSFPQDIVTTSNIMVIGNAGLHERSGGDLIARAILAERERCAKQAEYTGCDVGEPWLGSAIAVAILKGDN